MFLRTFIVLAIGIVIGMNLDRTTVDDAATTRLPGAAQKRQYDDLREKASGYEAQVRILESCARQATGVFNENDPAAAERELQRALRKCERKAKQAARKAAAASKQP